MAANGSEKAFCVLTFHERRSVTSRDQVYVPPLPANIQELKVRITTAIETITADMLQTVWNELDYRVDVCRITQGAHIEQL